MSVVVHTSVEL